MPHGGRIARARWIVFGTVVVTSLAWADRAGAGVGVLSNQRAPTTSTARAANGEGLRRPRVAIGPACPRGARDPRGSRDPGAIAAAEESRAGEDEVTLGGARTAPSGCQAGIGVRAGSARVAPAGVGPGLLTTHLRC